MPKPDPKKKAKNSTKTRVSRVRARAGARIDGSVHQNGAHSTDQSEAAVHQNGAHSEHRRDNRGRIPLDDPLKRELQFRCYCKYVNDQLTFSEIARELDMDRATVATYVRLEADRQADEQRDMRGAEIARSISRYEGIIRHYEEKMKGAGARGDEGRYIIEARKRLDVLLGLEAPLKIKDETVPDTATVVGALDTVKRAALLAYAAAQRKKPSE